MTLRAALAALALLAGHPAAAQDLPPPVQAQIDDARADCESFEAGDFSMTPDAVQQRDLTGDGVLDWVVDESHMDCSSAASMFCGTGGCELSLIVGDRVAETLARGWTVVDAFGRTVVLLDIHGALCGGIGPTPCVEALTWDPDNQRFTSVAPPVQ
ncbi:MAG: hypothetical protein AAGC86_13190 [Pseudomonadota bacterium]